MRSKKLLNNIYNLINKKTLNKKIELKLNEYKNNILRLYIRNDYSY
jgi:hypothetical protein